MLRVQPSRLDDFAYWRASDHDVEWWADWLTARTETDAMRRGTDFHRALESGDWSGWDFAGINPLILRPDLVEFPAQQVIADCLVVGRLDVVSGAIGIDYKTTTREPDLERYADSWQWRAYLTLMPRLKAFRYDVFRLHRTLPVVRDHQHLMLYRYPGMEEEVREIVSHYADSVRQLAALGLLEISEKGHLI